MVAVEVSRLFACLLAVMLAVQTPPWILALDAHLLLRSIIKGMVTTASTASLKREAVKELYELGQVETDVGVVFG